MRLQVADNEYQTADAELPAHQGPDSANGSAFSDPCAKGLLLPHYIARLKSQNNLFLFFLFVFPVFSEAEGDPEPGSSKLGKQKISGEVAGEGKHVSPGLLVLHAQLQTQSDYAGIWDLQKQLLACLTPLPPLWLLWKPSCCSQKQSWDSGNDVFAPFLPHSPGAGQSIPPCSPSRQQADRCHLPA